MANIDGTICEGVHAGRPMRFFVTDRYDLIQSHHMQGVFYETEELDIIAAHFPRGGVFADIGANIGNHTLFAGLHLHPSQIVVIEPNPAAIATLRINIALNGLQGTVDSTHLGLGLSDAPGRAVANVVERNLGATHLSVVDDPDGLVLVQGDAVFAGRRVDFIKLDVEGMEMRALAGLARTIATWRPPMFIEVDNHNAGDFQAWVARTGYVIARTYKRYEVNENFMLLPVERAGTA